jgi:transcriptional regulator with XRE-family HTH domain
MATDELPQRRAKLQALRIDRGHTLTTLAAAADITLGYMSLIESGHRNPRPPVVKRIADVLGVTPAELLITAA